MPRSSNATTRAALIAFDTRYAAPPTAIRYTDLCFLIASIAASPRSALPTMPSRPVCDSTCSVNLSMRVAVVGPRSEEHTSELQSLMRISYAVFCLKKKTYTYTHQIIHHY